MTSRRDVLRAFGGAAAFPFFGTMATDDIVAIARRAHALADHRRSGAPMSPPRALSAVQYDVVVQAAERIIPRTDTPGATDARVADFIDVMLADWYSAAERDRFTAGLSELDTLSRHRAGRAFAQTTAPQQTELLGTLDRELHARRQSTPAAADEHWFAMLKHLTIWGYYTSRPGIVNDLRVQLNPGRYDGNAKY